MGWWDHLLGKMGHSLDLIWSRRSRTVAIAAIGQSIYCIHPEGPGEDLHILWFTQWLLAPQSLVSLVLISQDPGTILSIFIWTIKTASLADLNHHCSILGPTCIHLWGPTTTGKLYYYLHESVRSRHWGIYRHCLHQSLPNKAHKIHFLLISNQRQTIYHLNENSTKATP